ncbi:MAG: MaoC family dehydratase N-terminal domain-containing protein [Actinomycetota bacterium]|nr:MaoC family dehydratase N-terminal domain-containing protein [Actinomycetota bacterium]
MAAKVRFDDVSLGDELPALSKVVKREDVKAYADASGDQNPLHQDDAFAQSVGFPGIIAHGMFSMAHVTKAVTDWLGDPGALKRMSVQFRAVVFMDETLVARARIDSLDPGTRRAKLSLWAEVQRDGETVLPIKNSEAEVELA